MRTPPFCYHHPPASYFALRLRLRRLEGWNSNLGLIDVEDKHSQISVNLKRKLEFSFLPVVSRVVKREPISAGDSNVS